MRKKESVAFLVVKCEIINNAYKGNVFTKMTFEKMTAMRRLVMCGGWQPRR